MLRSVLPLLILAYSSFAKSQNLAPQETAPYLQSYLYPQKSKSFHIVIDPGHGGSEKGAIRDSFVESKIVLEIAARVKERLNKVAADVKVTLTRSEDVSLTLKERVDLANSLNADLFVSLHANAASQNFLSGMEFYFNSSSPKKRITKNEPEKELPTEAEVIAQIKTDFAFYEKTAQSLLLSKTFKEKTVFPDQKSIIKRAPFYVVNHTKMPSVLIELGFISNRREAKKLSSAEYQDEMARQLVSAILEYKEKSDKGLSM